MEERIDRAEQRLDQHGELIVELRTATLANTRNIDRLTDISERFITVATDTIVRLDQNITRLDQAVEELRASNQRQEAINDYLIRRERERGDGNGSPN
ncbi:hypothetical protein [Gloeobacter morelensis]|uniref:Uncharacterized protein n=1 Tax=Gloeobacter morelensis MG652769 TaxID=2781736 RepID=A0ABY3PHF1_9CYAN|nr:hypothetical protein [Gloeobacter morelensis]UFP93074.1 hypothetical protein ISF26_14790 [Gloeobacter morelensis MG652769]